VEKVLKEWRKSYSGRGISMSFIFAPCGLSGGICIGCVQYELYAEVMK